MQKSLAEGFGLTVAEAMWKGRLLYDPHSAGRLGAAAQERVRDHFRGPRHLGQYVDLLERRASSG